MVWAGEDYSATLRPVPFVIMGFLSAGSTPLQWKPSEPYRSKVKEDGITQFLSVFKSARHFSNHGLKWGDEVEYTLVKLDHQRNTVKLSLRGPEIIEILQHDEHARPFGSSVPVLWRPEYANWMIEGTPGVPYRCYAADLALVERNMTLRRTEIAKLLHNDEFVLTITAFPRTGVANYTHPPTMPFGPVARSLFTSDDVINPHPRFATLTRNIRFRRNRKVDIRVPLFIDKNTKPVQSLVPEDPQHRELLRKAERVANESLEKNTSDDRAFMPIGEAFKQKVDRVIKMDSSAFGMGCSCLQVTLQARNMCESRFLYDQLATMAPLMLALTAGTPALRGLLADTDVRWNVISAGMDDRTEKEISSGALPKPRYSSIDCFISDREGFRADSYNDIPIPHDQESYRRLCEGDVDHLLAQHIAHLFIRDPLAIYLETVDQDNEASTDHFENIQSTNWNTVRFKPPPPGTEIGWRTEFRSMEVALTDFENAAFSVFIVLLSRVILAFDMNFYAPMSLVDANMDTAHERDAARRGMFHFRKKVMSSSHGSQFVCECGHIHSASLVGGHSRNSDIDSFCARPDSDATALMSLDAIFNGKPLCHEGRSAGFEFPGLLPLVRGYLDSIKIDESTRARLLTYLDFVSERAAGKLVTTASYLRTFIMRHPSYRQDSVVSEKICYDLVDHCRRITTGEEAAPELLGRFHYERLPAETETPERMMARMQEKLHGPQDGLLLGSSLPVHAVGTAIEMLARSSPKGTCGES